jgi:hypothetical protein
VRDELRPADVSDKNPQGGNGAESGVAALTADEYVARLKAEVSGHGRWHGWR